MADNLPKAVLPVTVSHLDEKGAITPINTPLSFGTGGGAEQNQTSSLANDSTQHQADNEIIYPRGVKLATISVAVALSVFLVALVGTTSTILFFSSPHPKNCE